MRRLIVLIGCATLLAACADAGSTPRTAQDEALPAASAGAVAPTSTAAALLEAEGSDIGVALSPKSYTAPDFPDFLELVRGEVDVLMHAGDWAGLDDPASPFHVLSTLATQQGADAVVVLGPSSADHLIRPLDEATEQRYLSSLRAFLQEHQPAYLGLANEVNMLSLENPSDFDRVVDLWDAALPVVREVSPGTQVFVTFQLERTLGRHDGWFGGRVVEADWSPIERFAGADLVGFTTYPSLVLDSPSEIGPDYYRQIADHVDAPIIFTEIGWSADPEMPILPGNEDEQVEFLDELARQIDELDVRAAVWSFVHDDLVTHPAFSETDLRRDDGSPRPSWDRWLALRR